MISLALAIELKKAGLVWQTEMLDFFAVPDRGMDEHVFVLSDMPAHLDVFRGWPVVTFHGTAEWALDYILTAEVVWLPREEQLREALFAVLGEDSGRFISLTFDGKAYDCSISYQDERLTFRAGNGAEAYGMALLHCLENGLVS